MSTEAETDHRMRDRKTARHDSVSTVTAERSRRLNLTEKKLRVLEEGYPY